MASRYGRPFERINWLDQKAKHHCLYVCVYITANSSFLPPLLLTPTKHHIFLTGVEWWILNYWFLYLDKGKKGGPSTHFLSLNFFLLVLLCLYIIVWYYRQGFVVIVDDSLYHYSSFMLESSFPLWSLAHFQTPFIRAHQVLC